MPIFNFYCGICNKDTEKIIPFSMVESLNTIACPKCKGKAIKREYELPAKFMGTFGNDGTAPSKRYSYKKVNPGEDGNAGSAV